MFFKKKKKDDKAGPWLEGATWLQTPCIEDPHLGCNPYGISSNVERANHAWLPFANLMAQFWVHNGLSQPLTDW